MNFFVLQNPKVDGGSAVTDFIPAESASVGEAPTCPVCKNHIGMLPLLPPIRAEIETWGTQFGDIAFGPSNEMLVTGRFYDLYRQAGLQGLLYIGEAQIVKVKSHRSISREQPTYHCCRPKQSRAAIDEIGSDMERVSLRVCEECRFGGLIKRVKRIRLEPGSWSGEDIF